MGNLGRRVDSDFSPTATRTGTARSQSDEDYAFELLVILRKKRVTLAEVVEAAKNFMTKVGCPSSESRDEGAPC